MEENYAELINQYTLITVDLVTKYISPVFEDHIKLIDYTENNRGHWNSTMVQALERSTEQCYKALHVLQWPYRMYLGLPFDLYVSIMKYNNDLLEDMQRTSGLKIDKTLQAACKGIYEKFPLHACGKDFDDADAEGGNCLSEQVKVNMDALRSVSEHLNTGSKED